MDPVIFSSAHLTVRRDVWSNRQPTLSASVHATPDLTPETADTPDGARRIVAYLEDLRGEVDEALAVLRSLTEETDR